MDQEVSKGMWTGSSLIMIVSVIGLAVVIFGLGRTISNGYITELGIVLTDSNAEELRELDGTTTNLTSSAIIGLIERNGKGISQCKFVGNTNNIIAVYQVKNNTLTSTVVAKKLSNYNTTTYVVGIKFNKSGAAELTIYVNS